MPARLVGTRYAGVLLAVWLAGAFVCLAQEAPPAAAAAPNPLLGSAADGKAFRILDRVTKELNRSILFTGSIARTVRVNRTKSGIDTICINCKDEGAAPPSEGAKVAPQGASPPAAGPWGDVLLLDRSNLWNPRYADGAFVFTNDAGFDADDRDYETYPSAGPSTSTASVGTFLFVANLLPATSGPGQDSASPFQLVMRRSGTTYFAPLAGGDTAPLKIQEEDPGAKDAREMARPHQQKAPDWFTRYPLAFTYTGGAARNGLLSAVALFAKAQETFLLVIDLRKLESKEASYFWAPYHGHRIIHLDEHILTVEGQQEGQEDAYEPTSYIEYPYLIVLGEYAKLRLASASGAPEIQLEIGYCETCP